MDQCKVFFYYLYVHPGLSSRTSNQRSVGGISDMTSFLHPNDHRIKNLFICIAVCRRYQVPAEIAERTMALVTAIHIATRLSIVSSIICTNTKNATT